MKKWLRILILCCVCVFATYTFVACDFTANAAESDTTQDTTGGTTEEPTLPDNPTPHEHNFGDWHVTVPATCTETGIEQRDCNTCDFSETQTIVAKGHKPKETITQEPTCGDAGIKTVTCENCDHTQTIEIPATGNHDHTHEVTTPPTCIIPGEMTHTCTNCGDIYTTPIPATNEHIYESKITLEPTCGTAGSKIFECIYCDDNYPATIPATEEHDYEVQETIAAGCETNGEQTFTCKVCNDHYTEIINAKGHFYSTEIIEATCQKQGYTLHQCQNCEYSYTSDETDIIDHNYHNHTCSHCGAQQPPFENLAGSYWVLQGKKWAIYFDPKNANKITSYNVILEDGVYQLDMNSSKGYEGDIYILPAENTINFNYVRHPQEDLSGYTPKLTYSVNENGEHVLTGRFHKSDDSTFIFVGYGV